MKQRINFLTALVLAAGALTASVTGCELIASVDRSKIAGGGGSGGGTGGATTSSSSSSGTGGTGGTNTGGTGGTNTGGTGGTNTGGTGGTGGMPPACDGGTECTAATDCPDTNNECILRTCDNGCCGTQNETDGHATTAQTDKDCKKVVCDGNGATKPIDDDLDLPAPSDACHVGTCTNGTPGQAPAAAGTACAFDDGKVCDGNGACVGCLDDGPCTANGQLCDTTAHKCVDPGCTNGIQDGTETDKDCGGSCGATCLDGKVCNGDGDCLYGFCKSGICTQPACDDSAQNGNETDVDCGGKSFNGATACPKCDDNKQCKENNDCTNGYCDTAATPHVCKTPACDDGVKNGSETGIDCGGSCVTSANKKCAVGQPCGGPNDCDTGYCSGSTCATKPAGLSCGANSECTSDICGANGNCCAAACTTTGTCGATGCHTGTGACDYPAASTPCGSTCSAGMLTVSTCNGSGTCAAGTPAACPNGLKCGSATACLTTCTADTDCVSSGDYCSGGACVPKKATGACTADDQCVSGACGGGNCCTAACNNTDPTCGTSACDATGACMYPTSATSCGTPGCNDNQLTTSACNGNGSCVAGTTDCAANGDVCSATLLACVECNSAADCAGAGCNGTTFTAAETCSAAGACVAGATTDCSTANKVCNGTLGCVECNVNADCAAASCSGSTLTPAETCGGSHTCTAGTAAACPNNLTCADATSCNTSCGSADAAGDAKCVSGFYCDGSACQATLASGTTCARDGECTSGTCDASNDAGPPTCL